MAGQFGRAIAEAKRAVELDPVSPIIHVDLGTVYLVARRYDEAIEQYRNTLEMNPEFYWAHRFLGTALELKGATGQAIAEYHKAFELSDDPIVLAQLAHAEVSVGKQNEGRQILAQLTEEAKARYVPAYAFAVRIKRWTGWKRLLTIMPVITSISSKLIRTLIRYVVILVSKHLFPQSCPGL